MKLSLRALVAGSFSKVWWYQIPEGKPQRLEFPFPRALVEVKRFLREKFSLKRLPSGTLIQTLPIKALPKVKPINREEFTVYTSWKTRAEDLGLRLVRTDQDFVQAFRGSLLAGQYDFQDQFGWLNV